MFVLGMTFRATYVPVSIYIARYTLPKHPFPIYYMIL